MSDANIVRIADELELIRAVLERAFPALPVPVPPERLLGSEAISYIEDDQLVELEEEELRQKMRGLIPQAPESE